MLYVCFCACLFFFGRVCLCDCDCFKCVSVWLSAIDCARLYESCCVLIVFMCLLVFGVNVFVCFVRGVL